MIENLKALLILYPSGASGEFISAALSESFFDISKSGWYWEGNNRCKFFDLFDRTLNSGFNVITEDQVKSGIEKYLSQCSDTSLLHIGFCHPDIESIEFVIKHLSFIPVLEIVTFNEKSKNFKSNAHFHKVKQTNFAHEKKYNCSNYIAQKHLRIEWSDLLLDDAENQFKKIENFIGITGDYNTFQKLVDDYITRNISFIK